MLKDLNHPNIPKVFGFYANEGYTVAYLVMEYLEGFIELTDYVTKYGTLSDNQVMEIVYLLSHAVAYLHNNGIAHRDIKP